MFHDAQDAFSSLASSMHSAVGGSDSMFNSSSFKVGVR